MLSVRLRPLDDLALALDRGMRSLEDLAHLLEPLALGALREESLLQLGCELEPGREGERELRMPGVRRRDVRRSERYEAGKERQAALDERVPRRDRRRRRPT